MGGIDIGNFMFGYTYDIGISDIKTYNDGTHEVFLGIKLNRGDSAVPMEKEIGFTQDLVQIAKNILMQKIVTSIILVLLYEFRTIETCRYSL